MVRIGNLELGAIPRVAVALSDVEVRQDAATTHELADVFELRIDQFQRHDPDYVAEITVAAGAHAVPLLATIRATSEGGVTALEDRQRLGILEAIVPQVDAVDIELQAPIRDQVVALAHAHGKPVILSYHNFDMTPPEVELAKRIDMGRAARADIVKIATTALSTSDCRRLLGLLHPHPSTPLIVIAMGAHGTMSRVFFPLIGSLLTWGFLHAPSAPGQLTLADLVAELRRYSPDFARERDVRQTAGAQRD